MNQTEFWLTFEIKHQPDTVLVDRSENDKVQSKKCQNCSPFFESSYPEIQRKHIPRVYEYQS